MGITRKRDELANSSMVAIPGVERREPAKSQLFCLKSGMDIHGWSFLSILKF